MAEDNTPPIYDPPPAYEPPPAYAPPPPYSAPAAASLTTAASPSGRRRFGVIGALAAVVITAGAVLAYFLFSSGSSGASTPQAAVKTLLEAGMHNDVNKAQSVLCASDRAIGQVSHLQSSGRITTYEIGAESSANGVRYVAATFATSKTWTPSTEKFPVVKEDGSWKVCFSRELTTAPGGLPTELTLPSVGASSSVGGVPSTGAGGSAQNGTPSLPPGIPGGGAGLCSGSTSGFGVASTYVGAAEIGVPQVAQACVYQNQVPVSVAQRLSGKLYAPVTQDQNASVIVFESTDRSLQVTVTTAKEADGHYYVTAVTTS